jgi:hypothetical protein
MRSTLRVILLLTAIAWVQVILRSADSHPPDDNPRYFPAGIFAAGRADDDFRARWYAEQLRALDEPTLSQNASTGAEAIYRFTWLRTFHHPISVRVVVHANGTGTMTVKMANGAGGYNPGKLIANSSRELDTSAVRRIRDLVQTMGFWQMPPEPGPKDPAGLDGAECILEASSRGTYHVVDRWSPQKGYLRELGLYMALTLGKLDVPARTIY